VRFCAVGALWRAASELTDDLDVFLVAERTALQVVRMIRPARRDPGRP